MMITTMVIGGEKFSGKTGDWADVKTEYLSAITNAGFSYVMRWEEFKIAGSGDHNDVRGEELSLHFGTKQWSTQLLSIQSQVTKSTLDPKCEEYLALSDKKRAHFRDWKVTKAKCTVRVTQ
jgi:hypothetical protein